MKPIQLQYDLPKGATAFIMKADNQSDAELAIKLGGRFLREFFLRYSPLQPVDEFYIQEEFVINTKYPEYIRGGKQNLIYKNSQFSFRVKGWKPKSQMTYEQSRHKGVCVSVELKRVQDMRGNEREKASHYSLLFDFKSWLDQNFGHGTYEQNPWVFVVTFKEK